MGHFPFPFPMPPHFALLDMPVTHSVTGKKGFFSVHSSSERTGAFIRDSLFLLSLTLKGSIATGYTFQNKQTKNPQPNLILDDEALKPRTSMLGNPLHPESLFAPCCTRFTLVTLSFPWGGKLKPLALPRL